MNHRSARPIWTITAREVADMLSDWRLLLPILIMTFVFPTVLVAGSDVVIRFLGEPRVVRSLVPFVMLLIGFIPASFSLITALESFVGERERNSLEALLAMPISDNQLYVSKLISSLVPPLLSALLAMSVFAAELRLFQPALFNDGLKPAYLGTIALLIVVKAVLMVAGAVIISSHTTSIRAANLLASFVLLPTAALVQIEALYIIGGRWELLRVFALLLLLVATILVRTGMGAFNREEILSREHEQLNLRRVWATFGLFLREYQPVHVAPNQYSGARFGARRFYRHELPALLREYRLPLVLALLAALSGVGFGAAVGQARIPAVEAFLEQQIGRAEPPGPALALALIGNNLRVSLLSNLLSLLAFGVLAFLVPALAFGQVSLIASSLSARGGEWLALSADSPLQFLLAYILPHGIIELPAAVLGAAMGLRIGASLMSTNQGVSVGRNILWSLAQFFKVWALVLLPLFVVGGLVEGFITPLVVRALY